ncbi:C-type lectin domain family 10 member A-like [Sigmodon hispidus]
MWLLLGPSHTNPLGYIVLHSDFSPLVIAEQGRVLVSRLHTVLRAPEVCIFVNKTMIYENVQNLGSEEKNRKMGTEAPPKSFLWNIFSWTHLLLFSLGLGFLLLVVVSVIGSQSGCPQAGREEESQGCGGQGEWGRDGCKEHYGWQWWPWQ